ncbi:MAG: DNA-binding protein HU [Thermodesulfovibrio sp.]|nr:DNA-binding protein HU [Thermodesulfovibrio sp.]
MKKSCLYKKFCLLESFIAAVKSELKKGKKLILIGFGTFSVAQRKARKGRNPRTGAVIKIPAKKVPKFSAGAGLKKAVLK